MAKTTRQREEQPDPRLARIAEEYRGDRRVTQGKSFSSIGLRVDNKIFAMVNRGRLVVKLPKARVNELVAAGVAERFEPGPGRIMKEWAVFPESTAKTKPSWASLAREAYRYVSGSAAE
jgi:TfoX/Sxy family transcriptional regulator of competence genes